MSEFTFTNDLDNASVSENLTATSVADTPETGAGAPVDKAGTATESYATCSIKKLLATMRANSTVTVCGDLRISSGDLYLLPEVDENGNQTVGGAAGSSLVKEIGLVYGTLSNAGVFTMLDPNPSPADDATFRGQIDDTEEDDDAVGGDADLVEDYTSSVGTGDESVVDGTLEDPDADGLLDTRGGKWYFRVVRPSGDVRYVEIGPLNNLIDAMSAVSGETKSILGLVEDLGALQTAIKSAMEKEFDARVQDVNDLEDRLNLDITSLQNWLKDMEYRVVQYAADEDVRLTANLTAAQIASGNTWRQNHADVRLEGFIDMTVPQVCGGAGVSFESPYEIKAAQSDIKKWMIQASVMELDGNSKLKLRHDLDLFIDAIIEAEAGNTGMYRLKVDTSPVQCENEDGLKLGVKAIWCGDQPDMPARPAAFAEGGYTEVPSFVVNTGDAADADQSGRKLGEISAPSIPADAAINGSGSTANAGGSAAFEDVEFEELGGGMSGSQNKLIFASVTDADAFMAALNSGSAYLAVPADAGEPTFGSTPDPTVYISGGASNPQNNGDGSITFTAFVAAPFTGNPSMNEGIGLQPGGKVDIYLDSSSSS